MDAHRRLSGHANQRVASVDRQALTACVEDMQRFPRDRDLELGPCARSRAGREAHDAGLALARQMGSVVMQGFVLAYLFAYMVFYYYSLAVPFSLKSLYLVATGLGLLAVALVLRLWQAKHTAGEASHA